MDIHMDFETRSIVDLQKTGAEMYSRHPSTRILCLVYKTNHDEKVLLTEADFNGGSPKVQYLKQLISTTPGILLKAFNDGFERAIYNNILVPKYGFPVVQNNQWRCVMAKANVSGFFGDLGTIATAMGLPITKDGKGRAVMLKMCKPRKPRKGECKDTILWHDKPEDYEILYSYCGTDVDVEEAIDNALPDLPPDEQGLREYDMLINGRGIQIDMNSVHNMISTINYFREDLTEELKLITGGQVQKGTDRTNMFKFLNDRGANMSALNADTIAEAIASGRITGPSLRVLELRQMLSKTSLAKYDVLTLATDSPGILRGVLQYYGAHTGRWAGRLVQTQNLPRGNMKNPTACIDLVNEGNQGMIALNYPDIFSSASACIRGMFVPREGKDMIVVDYAAIEARVLAWLVWDTDAMQRFSDEDAGLDEDSYVKMARQIFNDNTITKKGDSAAGTQKRQLGKQAVLGCGYGMGAERFQETCASYGMDIDPQMADLAVQTYRRVYPKVTKFWKDIERGAKGALTGQVFQVGPVQWSYDQAIDRLFCELPSGRKLAYNNPRIEPHGSGTSLSHMKYDKGQWVRRRTWGGGLTENIDQAVARDVMAYAIPRAEHAGYEVLLHTHDELITEVPKGQGSPEHLASIMCELPEWASHLPLNGEGKRVARYMK